MPWEICKVQVRVVLQVEDEHFPRASSFLQDHWSAFVTARNLLQPVGVKIRYAKDRYRMFRAE